MHCKLGALPLLFHWWLDPQISDQSFCVCVFFFVFFCFFFVFFALVNRLNFSHYCLDNVLSIIMTTRLWNLVGNFWIYEWFLVERKYCLKTPEIGQMRKIITVHKNLLMKSKVFNQIWWFLNHDDGNMLLYLIIWKKLHNVE